MAYVEPDCPLCGSRDRRPVFAASRAPRPLTPEELGCATSPLASTDAVVRCRACGLLYTCPRPDDAELAAGYRALRDEDFLSERRARELTYARMLRRLDRLTRGRRGRLLDAGCAMGFFLDQARRGGWTVEGLDASDWAAGYARDTYGLPVRAGPIREARLEAASYDVITIWDVVEHLTRPVEDFTHLARALKPGGVLALSTHSIRSLSARVLGSRYPFLMPMHTMHFTPRTTAALLAKAGLRQVTVRPHIRMLRLGYLFKKAAQRWPRAGGAAGTLARGLGLADRHVPVTGLGIFEAYAIKEG